MPNDTPYAFLPLAPLANVTRFVLNPVTLVRSVVTVTVTGPHQSIDYSTRIKHSLSAHLWYKNDQLVSHSYSACGEIRLFDIQPSGRYDSPIICRLRHACLPVNPKCECSSYVWGRETGGSDMQRDDRVISPATPRIYHRVMGLDKTYLLNVDVLWWAC